MSGKMEMKMHPASLFYGVFWLGGKEVFGVNDPFAGMDKEEIAAAAGEAQAELDAMEYGKMDFSGGFSLKEEAESLLKVCTFCDAYLVMEKCSPEGLNRQVFYFKDGQEAALTEDGEYLLLSESDVGGREEVLSGWLNGGEKADEWEGKCQISISDLTEAMGILKEEGKEKAKAFLLRFSDTPMLWDTLLDGFLGEIPRFILQYTRFDQDVAASCFVYGKQENAVFVENAEDGYSKNWNLKCVTGEGTAQEMRDWMKRNVQGGNESR